MLLLRLFRLPQPERDRSWLHGLLHHRQQLLAHLLQIKRLSQRGAEGSQRLFRIILAAIEAPINDMLEALAERLEERGNRQRRDDEHQRIVGDLSRDWRRSGFPAQ